MRAKAVTQGGPAPRLRAWAPDSARATEKEELGTICLVQTTIPRHVRANARERVALAIMGSSRRTSSICTAVVGTICWVPGAMKASQLALGISAKYRRSFLFSDRPHADDIRPREKR